MRVTVTIWSLFLLCPITHTLIAQSYLCDRSLRYEDYVVLRVDTVENVLYRSAESLRGVQKQLKMDIFMPSRDRVVRRPAVVLAHGGGFVAGKKESLHKHCMEMASRGYVCASVEYRLIDTLVLNEKDYLEGAMRAVMDVAYSINFLRTNALAQNDFGIDPELIFVGGFSAGAVAALHVNFLGPGELDALEFSPPLQKEWEQLNSSGVSYRPAGALSFAGALLDSCWIDPDDPPLMSYHNTGDQVVPCGKGVSKRSISKSQVYGSCFIHNKLDAFPDYAHEFKFYERKGHMDFLGRIRPLQFYQDISSFLKTLICRHYENMEKTDRIIDIDYSPNPHGNTLRLKLALAYDEAFVLNIVKPDGTVAYEKQYPHAQRILFPANDLEDGIYLVRLIGASDETVERLMILH